MPFQIAVLRGDGIGPEVTEQAVRVLETVGRVYGHTFIFREGIVGGVAIDRYGTPLPASVLEMCRGVHGVLFGAVGGPKWDDLRAAVHPEEAIFGLRKELRLYANLRPIHVYPELAASSPVKDVAGVDILFVRELTGGLYYGRPKRRWETRRGRRAVDTLLYTEREIERVLHTAFELAYHRHRRLILVDKFNALESSRLWREVALELTSEYPEVHLKCLLVGAFAMQLLPRPREFDVVVTENLFGDILTDEAAVLTSSLGMVPSASLGPRRRGRVRRGRISAFGLYEPIHGSAPDIAGQDKANPLGAILSTALLLRHSCGLEREAGAVEQAVALTLERGYRTADIATDDERTVRPTEMGHQVMVSLEEIGERPPRPRRRRLRR